MDLTSLAGQQAAIFQQDFTKEEAPLSFAHTNALLAHPELHPPLMLHFWTAEQTVILGMQDLKLPQFGHGLPVLASDHYGVFVRNSGGLAVIADSGVLNVSLFLPNEDNLSIDTAYDMMTALFRTAFPSLPIATSEIIHSYCPGKYDLSVHGRKFAGMAQRRNHAGVVVMLYCSIFGDQNARCDLLRRFYRAGHASASPHFKFPIIRSETMTTLSDLLGRPLTRNEAILALLNALAANGIAADMNSMPAILRDPAYHKALAAATADLRNRNRHLS
ncbi:MULTISPECIES: biotin/lipoate A/B protein ligase family protein [Lacticaseibacillus]|uniref:Lipoate--protein ligase n=3 Tax=Lacticaseibacillus TaxID=2759736 RepID=A0AAN1F0J6_LACCA|nr:MULTISPECIES: lipoate--protein ligase [Lacticaseibacillus]ARY92508.1 lipoate--protein ligase [Lacticaseibacillus casei]KAB1969653.1 lipoate--protein ligase family protein [Lacticaseibacillus casei]MDE3283531.1 lipoate--protein ligase family protein [Lacticaseibacillus casei]WLV77649.1 lipoate--protein ligase family protein [Lacticaseibacillus sp. NCIMB 15471]WLV80410.1 lipoate--protein ligase family protein [Lacticaseibacillus sp. NCIMB 15473]